MKVPNHLAVILDGNGRWAKERKMPRSYGHSQGSKNVEDMCEIVYNRGIKYFTIYAFSTENWSRPDKEVETLMKLLRNYMKTAIKRASKNNMKVRVIGDLSKLDGDLRESILKLEDATKDFTGLNFQIAINYGSRDEIVRAVNRIMADQAAGKLIPGEMNEELFASYLDTRGIPDPDLLIRTSGEKRLSNYLLWQLAYTEFYFTDVHWPAFDAEELERAIDAYNQRDRRFGNVEE